MANDGSGWPILRKRASSPQLAMAREPQGPQLDLGQHIEVIIVRAEGFNVGLATANASHPPLVLAAVTSFGCL